MRIDPTTGMFGIGSILYQSVRHYAAGQLLKCLTHSHLDTHTLTEAPLSSSQSPVICFPLLAQRLRHFLITKCSSSGQVDVLC